MNYLLCVIFQVLMTSLAVEKVSYWEGDNLWIGPRNVSKQIVL